MRTMVIRCEGDFEVNEMHLFGGGYLELLLMFGSFGFCWGSLDMRKGVNVTRHGARTTASTKVAALNQAARTKPIFCPAGSIAGPSYHPSCFELHVCDLLRGGRWSNGCLN